MAVPWDRQLEDGLPDCRLKDRARNTVVLRGMLMERVYCCNCGADGGYVTADWTPFVFYICDPCFEIYGAPPAQRVPDTLMRGE